MLKRLAQLSAPVMLLALLDSSLSSESSQSPAALSSGLSAASPGIEICGGASGGTTHDRQFNGAPQRSIAVLGGPAGSIANCFDAAVNYAAGDAVSSAYAADIDGDNDLDLTVANNLSGTVSVFLNNGDGAFATPVDYSVEAGPLSVFAADLDGDDDADLAVANNLSHTVSVLLNNGAGAFASAVNYFTWANPTSVFAADLDGDGDADLAVAISATNNVAVLLNNGDGTFGPATDKPTDHSTFSVAAADLDADGDADLVASGGGKVSVLKNNGDGTFALRVNYPAGGGAISLFASDLDGDGDADLATANSGSDNISVLMNNGDGTFTAPVQFMAGDAPQSVFAADMDLDGDLDVVVANAGSDNVSILSNNGDGTFLAATSYSVGAGPQSVFAASLGGGLNPDLGVANWYSDNLTVLLDCQGPSGISCPYEHALIGGAGSVQHGEHVANAGDVNNDGMDDIIVGDMQATIGGVEGAGRAYVYSGANASVLYTFAGTEFMEGFGLDVAGVGDVNGDGHDDVFISSALGNEGDGGRAQVFSGQDGSILHDFLGSTGTGDGFGFSISGAGDVDNDGYPDLIVGAPYNDDAGVNAGRVNVYSGLTGTFFIWITGESPNDLMGYAVSDVGDLNNDGHDDLLIGAPGRANSGAGAGAAYVISGMDGGTHLASWQGSIGDSLGAAVSGAGDVNNDGIQDVILGMPAYDIAGVVKGGVRVCSGQPGGAVLFTHTGEAYNNRFGAAVASAGDVDLDQHDDYQVGAPQFHDGAYYIGKSYTHSGRTGTLICECTGVIGAYLGSSVAALRDLNGDGLPEMVVGAPGQNTAYVIPPCCDCPFQADLDESGAVDAVDLALLIDIVFFGQIDLHDPGCTSSRSDFNADRAADAVDLAQLIDHVFFGGAGPTDPCGL